MFTRASDGTLHVLKQPIPEDKDGNLRPKTLCERVAKEYPAVPEDDEFICEKCYSRSQRQRFVMKGMAPRIPQISKPKKRKPLSSQRSFLG